jgi:exonuclease III
MNKFPSITHSELGDSLIRTLEELPILSWNIHDSIMSKEGPKASDQMFVNMLTQSVIFCLQETKGDFFLQNYECFNSTRPDSRSGGVCIGVHRSLSKDVKLIETGYPDFQALTVFPNDEKTRFTIINVYDSPEQSSYKAKQKGKNADILQRMTTLEQLLEFKNQNPSLGEILLVGDLNARTGNLNFDPEEDEPEEDQESVPNSHPGPENRTSKDGVINSRGNIFLDFLACCKLSLLNGCFLGDILGEFTSINYNGASVVDYMAATPNLLESIESFKVLELSKFSDHKPCLCKLKRKNHLVDPDELLESLENVPQSYKWASCDEDLHHHFYQIKIERSVI